MKGIPLGLQEGGPKETYSSIRETHSQDQRLHRRVRPPLPPLGVLDLRDLWKELTLPCKEALGGNRDSWPSSLPSWAHLSQGKVRDEALKRNTS